MMATSPFSRVTVIRAHRTEVPSVSANTAAVSAWPTPEDQFAEARRSLTSSSVSSEKVGVAGSDASMFKEKALSNNMTGVPFKEFRQA